MMLKIARIVLFARDMEELSSFYGEVLGLPRLSGAEPGWREFDAGGCSITLSQGRA